MNKEEIQELMDYNLEYLEARNSEEIFGGDYTSSVDLKYANKEIDKLLQENKQLKEQRDKAIKYIEESIKNPMFAEYICANDNGEVENLDKLLEILRGTND